MSEERGFKLISSVAREDNLRNHATTSRLQELPHRLCPRVNPLDICKLEESREYIETEDPTQGEGQIDG